MAKDCYYRVATSEAGLDTGYFAARGLPPPDLVTFEPFSTRRPASQGGESRQGYRSCSVLWNRLDSLQATAIYTLIETAETTSGDKVISFNITNSGPTRFGFIQYSDDNFIVHLLRSDGSWVRGLVNDGNRYTGEKIEKLEAGSYNLEITTTGRWTIIILPPQ